LLKGCLKKGDRETADGLLRAALGLSGCLPDVLASVDHDMSRCRCDLQQAMVTEIIDGIIRSSNHSDDLSVALLRDVQNSGIPVDTKIKLHFTARVSKSELPFHF